MCGIVGVISYRDVAPLMFEGLKRLEYRGYDSAGIAVIHDGKIICKKVVGRVAQLESFVNNGAEGLIGIAHTRWATHGEPTEKNAHPHFDPTGQIALVHNGVIENYSTLKEYLKKKGHEFASETDSEIVAHLIGENLELGFLAAVRRAISLIEGAFGLLIINRNDPHRLIAVRKGSPMVIGVGDREYIVASDVSAMVDSTRQVIYLNDGEIAEITPTGMRTSTFDDVTILKETEEIDWEIGAIEKAGYDHFMLKEIYEQPQSLADTFRGRLKPDESMVKMGGLDSLDDDFLRQLRRIIITACGTSFHAGLIGEFQLEELGRVPVEVEYASEFRYRNPIVTPEELTIVISQSGETADTLAALREAKTKGSKVMGICNVVGSTIARESGTGVYTHAGPEIGVASTKAFSTQCAVLAMFAIHLGRLRNLSPEAVQNCITELARIPDQVSQALETDRVVKEIAEEFADCSNYLYLGRGVNYPVALEGALKLKEISYIHAEGYPAAEMKHGPIALIDENMPALVIATRTPVYEKIMINIAQIKARKGKVIAVATEGDEDIVDKVDRVIYVPETIPLFSPFVTIVPLQLLAYHTAVYRGCDVDKPRNLAKSVTVE